MSIKRATSEDPRGIIAESYHIEDLHESGARAIFLDWAMRDAPEDPQEAAKALLSRHEADFPDHPMTQILREAQTQTASPKRRRRRKN